MISYVLNMSIFIKSHRLSEKAKQMVLNFFRDWLSTAHLRNYSIIILFFSVLDWLMTYGIYRQSEDQQLILHYNIKFGADQIGNPANLFLLPAAGLLVFIANLIAAYLIKSEKNFIAHVLLLSSLLFNELILAAIWGLYLINFR